MGFAKLGNTYIEMNKVAKIDLYTVLMNRDEIYLFARISRLNGSQANLMLGKYKDTTESEIIAEAERMLLEAMEQREGI